MLALWPHPQKTVYGDPITSMHTVRKALPMPDTTLQPQTSLVSVPQAPVVTYTAPAYTAPSTDAKSYALSRVGSAQFSCLDSLWTKESGWRVDAYNPSGAYGIPQSLPASKMATAGADYLTNPITQINWGLSYIQATYQNPCNAWYHSQLYNWY